MGFTAALAASAVAATSSVVQGQQAAKANKKAAAANKAAVDHQTNLEAQAEKRANAMLPDANALFAKNQADARRGTSGTMLTGSSGVDQSTLTLGKNTLLGA